MYYQVTCTEQETLFAQLAKIASLASKYASRLVVHDLVVKLQQLTVSYVSTRCLQHCMADNCSVTKTEF